MRIHSGSRSQTEFFWVGLGSFVFCRAGSQLRLLHFTGKKQLPGALEQPDSHYTKEFSHFPLPLNLSIPRMAALRCGELSKALETPVSCPQVPAHVGTWMGDAQRQLGLMQPHSTPNSEKHCQCHFPNHSLASTDPQHCKESHSGIITAQITKNSYKLSNSALGKRHLGLCLPCTTCCARQLTHSPTAAVIMGRSAPTHCLTMLP